LRTNGRGARPLLWCALLALATAARGPARERGAPWRVTWSPAHPAQGSVVSLSVGPESLAVARPMAVPLTGVAAGEPLHFEAVTGGATYWALAAIPLEAPDSLMVSLTIERAGGAIDTLTIRLPVASRAASTEQLHALPEFSRSPDSSLVARAKREEELMRAARRRSHDTPRLWREPFVRPVPGRVTSAFGVWREWDGVREGRHDGVDLAGAAGASVRASNRGVVALVAEQYYGGLTVLIDHGAGLVTSYQHLSRATVAVGETLVRGRVIGRVGASGKATGPHLHWGTSYGAVSVDPLALLAVEPP
jgi:hypothetical protein